MIVTFLKEHLFSGSQDRFRNEGNYRYAYVTSKMPFGATKGASEIVGLARAKLRRGTSN